MTPITASRRLPIRPVRRHERDLGDGNLRRILPVDNPAPVRQAVQAGSGLLDRLARLFTRQTP